jgi:hypothetical protein
MNQTRLPDFSRPRSRYSSIKVLDELRANQQNYLLNTSISARMQYTARLVQYQSSRSLHMRPRLRRWRATSERYFTLWKSQIVTINS